MTDPLVTIICTNYNKGAWIVDAIESFLRQDADFEFEILLVDDKSTDGSDQIIKKYTQIYSDKIRAVYNEKNIGITKTWIKACKEARGEYIARCDGDDYWIDNSKLQIQIESMLNKSSKWCSTDYNIVSEDGHTKTTSAIESGATARVIGFEDMLVTQGFTIPSSWVVESKLMEQVNSRIDIDAVDDTFNIQLELFQSTDLLYIPKSTVAYRMPFESDSRPADIHAVVERNNKLLKTQYEYIEKFPNSNFKSMLITSLEVTSNLKSVLYDYESKMYNLKEQLKLQETRIELLNKELCEANNTIYNLVNSKKYKLINLIFKPIELLRGSKSEVKKHVKKN